jgi:hypothetical protein
VARRIEIELTSARPDGSWTWRAAGAREPKGVLDGGLLPDGTKAGAVLRAEAEFEIDGITIVAVLAPKDNTRADPQRIEIIGSGRPEGPGVTTQLVGRGDRRPGERRRDRDETRPRRDRDAARPQNGRDGRDGRRPRRDGRRPDEDGSSEATAAPESGREGEGHGPAEAARPDRPDRPGRSRRAERTDRPDADKPAEGRNRPGPADRGESTDRAGRSPAERSERGGSRTSRPRADGGAGPADASMVGGRQGDRSGRRRDRRTPEQDGEGERRTRRFSPGRAHRQAVMASLPPEQQPIAEQVLRGGIPAVRTALHLEREKAVAEGRPAPNTDQLIAMAEELLPRLKAAEWRDRAEAAVKDVDEISLRDIRSVVAGADVARDEESRALAASLREALDQRVDGLRQQWTGEIAKHLEENRVVRALRLAARPPEPSARMDPELTQRLSDAAGEAMGSDTPPDRWLALIDAVSASPVRRSVKPAGLPADPTPELRRAAHQQSGRIPALAAMLGVAIPPPPTPLPGRRRGAASRDPRPAAGAGDSGRSDLESAAAESAGDDADGGPDLESAESAAAGADAVGRPDLESAESAPTEADEAGAPAIEPPAGAPTMADEAGAPDLQATADQPTATGVSVSAGDPEHAVVAQELSQPVHEG